MNQFHQIPAADVFVDTFFSMLTLTLATGYLTNPARSLICGILYFKWVTPACQQGIFDGFCNVHVDSTLKAYVSYSYLFLLFR